MQGQRDKQNLVLMEFKGDIPSGKTVKNSNYFPAVKLLKKF